MSEWQDIGRGRFGIGDCFDLMQDIPDRSVNMVLCDLPYGTTQNKWDSALPLDRLWREYERVLAPPGNILLTAAGLFTGKLMTSNPSWFRYKLVWEKSKATNFLNAKKQPLRKHEDVLIFNRGGATYNPQMSEGEAYDKGIRKAQQTGSYGDFAPVRVISSGQRYPTDVVYFATAESEGPVWHPTQKPVPLFEYLIRTYTDDGMTVLDNTAGSGTTAIAAERSNRGWICIERDEEYAAKAIARIRAEVEPLGLFA